jgi:hypothetical protein
MSTRSLTRIHDESGKEVCCIYVHGDGYPDGVGRQLADFIVARPLVRGISGSDRVANGMTDLAAQIVVHLKGDRVGGTYLYAPGTSDCSEEYVYAISHEPGPSAGHPGSATLACYGAGTKGALRLPALFSGSAGGYLKWLEDAQGEDE